MKHVAILGAGNMGTALAVVAAKNAPVTLWSVEPDVVAAIARRHANPKYLPGVKLPARIRATGSLADAVRGAALVVVAVPSHIVPSLARTLTPLLSAGQDVLNAAKGVDDRLRTVAEVLRDALPRPQRSRVAAMSGPSIANEFSRGLPCAVTVAASSPATARRVAARFATASFRAVPSADFRGVALGGTLKNIYALGLGMADGLRLGMNAKAALATASLAELAALLVRLGGRRETAYALAGVGDLIVTGMSEHSRNRRFGEELCLDPTCRVKLTDPTQTIEGAKAVAAVAPFARRKKLRTPILLAIDAVLFRRQDPRTALARIFRSL